MSDAPLKREVHLVITTGNCVCVCVFSYVYLCEDQFTFEEVEEMCGMRTFQAGLYIFGK